MHDNLNTSIHSELSDSSITDIREGEDEKVTLTKYYKEAAEIALLTLNFDKQKRRNSSFTESIGRNLEDQLLQCHNNNKFYIPSLSEYFEGTNTKFWKFYGERIFTEASAQLNVLSNGDFIPTKIILTNYRLLFVPSDQTYKSTKNLCSDYFSIPHALIKHVYKGLEKRSQSPNTIYISTKHGHKFRFIFRPENMDSFTVISHVLEELIPFTDIRRYFAFTFHVEYPSLEASLKGWDVYSVDQEFTRQGLVIDPDLELSNILSNPQRYAFKKIQNLTPDGKNAICESYPQEVIIPRELTIEELVKSSNFRSRNRFPALVYCYRRMVTLWRSSQCKPGLGLYNYRSEEDEMFLRLIGDPFNKGFNEENGVNVHIYDARPYLNAVANKMGGKGYENTAYYKNSEIFFLQIDNIHSVRDSYRKLIQYSVRQDWEKWTSNHELSGWFNTISLIISGAKTIIEKSLKKGINVLVHCSDGWDRTTQLISLTQILLDPYYRTIEGFEVLIEKDWVSFGHMFKTRNRWKSYHNFEEDKRSPVFIQFLDCVHQLLNQFPSAFEFNLKFLTDLAYYSQTGLFGTFLCDNDGEMTQMKVKESTTSIWSFINANKKAYVASLKGALGENFDHFQKQININLANLRYWKELFSPYTSISIEKPKFDNIEIASNMDLYEMALRYQIGVNDRLKNENEMLHQKIKELTAKEGDKGSQKELDAFVDCSPRESPTDSKEENEFLVVNEKNF